MIYDNINVEKLCDLIDAGVIDSYNVVKAIL